MTTKLERAFSHLEIMHDILAMHDCECCSTCAHALLSEELLIQPHLRGYAFYHGQDLDSARDDGELYIRFAARSDAAQDTAAVGQTVADTLRSCGLEVEWEGDAGRAILVHIPEEELHFFDRLRPGEGEGEEDEEGDDADEEEGEEEEEEDSIDSTLLGSGREWPMANLANLQRLEQQLHQELKKRQPRASAVVLPYASESFELA